MELTTKQKAAFGIGAVGKDMVYALSAHAENICVDADHDICIRYTLHGQEKTLVLEKKKL